MKEAIERIDSGIKNGSDDTREQLRSFTSKLESLIFSFQQTHLNVSDPSANTKTSPTGNLFDERKPTYSGLAENLARLYEFVRLEGATIKSKEAKTIIQDLGDILDIYLGHYL